MKQFLLATATAAVLAASVMSAPAYAASDYKMYNGSDCKVFGATAWTDLNFTGYGVKNTQTSPRNIICPIVKDQEGVIDGTTNTGAMHFHLSAPNIASSINCTVYSTGLYDETTFLSNATGPKNYSGATNDFWDVVVPNGVSGDYAHDHLYMLCTLGPGMRLLGYRVSESGAATNTP